jgi:hypothetical protein
MTRNDATFRFQKALFPMIAEQLIHADAAAILIREMGDCLDLYREGLELELMRKINEWETGMGEADHSLYSLGLRHAVDLITEFDPTSMPFEEKTVDEQEPS